MKRRTLHDLAEASGPIANLVRTKRKLLGITQIELAQKVGVGLRFLKELEQGKQRLQLDKVNEVLRYFGYIAAPTPLKKENPFEDDNV